MELDDATAVLFSDADVSTWEPVILEYVPPVGTSYIALKVRAGEDVFNDLIGAEFDGHYVDAVELTIVPDQTNCDLNGDGFCDVMDIDALSARIRDGQTDPAWDFDNSGTVDSHDRAIWVHEVLQGPLPPAVAAVPEPETCLLLGIGLVVGQSEVVIGTQYLRSS